MDKAQYGWAVAEKGTVMVNTVSETRRGAIVNFLVTKVGIMIYASHSDNAIEELWDKNRKTNQICTVVRIETVAQAIENKVIAFDKGRKKK